MLSDSLIHKSSGLISSGIEHEESLKAVILFLRNHCKIFATLNKGATDLNEKGLSQKLCILLNRKAKSYPFFFHPEFMEDVKSGVSPQIDIGTISQDEKIEISDREYNEEDSFFSLEAKRLPTPGTNREKEYVTGHNTVCGAMERFKKGVHGSRLKYAAIIGYVQAKTFEHWFLEINTWIAELASNKDQPLWTTNDSIKKIPNGNDDFLIELSSENSRHLDGIEKDRIRIFHFWINLEEKE